MVEGIRLKVKGERLNEFGSRNAEVGRRKRKIRILKSFTFHLKPYTQPG